MAGQVDIELGELTNSDQPSETTRFTPDDSQRYGSNFLSSLSLLREIIAMLKGFVTIQRNFAEMQSFTIGGATSFQTADNEFQYTEFTSYISVRIVKNPETTQKCQTFKKSHILSNMCP